MELLLLFGCAGIFSQLLCSSSRNKLNVSSRDEYVCMKSMVSDYTSVQHEITAYEVLTKVGKTSRSIGKQYVRQALDHFELRHANRSYHFLIHEPLGVTVQFFLDISRGSLPIPYVQELASQILHGLEFTHNARVTHAGLTSSDNTPCPPIHL